MKSLSLKLKQIRLNWLNIFLVAIISAILLTLVLLLHIWKGIPIGNLTRDPHGIYEFPFYIGFISQVGILLWSATSAICIFSASVLSRDSAILNIRQFLFVSGLFTLILCFDDAFMLHESFFPYHVGVPEEIIFFCYVGFALYYLLKFHVVIIKTDCILLGVALVFFTISIISDLLYLFIPNSILFEDGAKLVAIISWFVYFSHVAVSAVNSKTVR